MKMIREHPTRGRELSEQERRAPCDRGARDKLLMLLPRESGIADAE